MDINNYNFQEYFGFQDYFGFEGYARSKRSNLDFLNFSIEDTDAYKTLTSVYQRDLESLRNEYFAKADALGYSDSVKAQKDAIYAELERKLKTRKIKYEAEVALLKVGKGANQAQAGINKVEGLLDLFGIRREPNAPATVQVNQGQTGNETAPNRTPLYIGLGVVAIGVVGFIAYKMTK
jgi:hypothetical protein